MKPNPFSSHWRRALLPGLFALSCGGATAWEMQGHKTLSAHTRDGQSIRLASVHFAPPSDGASAFTITLEAAQFSDHFLSMKEFKCATGPGELMCHVPYPYPQPRTVTPTDLRWLEHSLLFMFKLPRDFGAKLWNGLYFRLERTERGLLGKPQAIDLNHISAPPAQPALPPYRPALREDIAGGERWITFITIE